MSDAEYRKRLKLERDRERSRRKWRQGRFEASIMHIDFDEAESRAASPSWLSDRGKGADAIIDAVDGETPENVYERRLNTARKRIVRHCPELLDVFNLIVKNGSNRKESIWWLMSKRRRNGTPQTSSTGDT